MKISVVIPAHNGGRYIRQCLESVLNQSRLPDQIVVVIDRSTDNTQEICEQFGSSIEIHHNFIPTGFVDAWNRAVSKARYEWICLLHQDDLLEPDFLETAERIATKNPDIHFIYGLCNYIDREGQSFQEPQSFGSLEYFQQTGVEYSTDYAYNRANRCPGVIARREVFQRVPFRNEAGLVADNDFFWRVGFCYDVIRIDRRIASFRHHPDSATHTFPDLTETMLENYMWLYEDYRTGRSSVHKAVFRRVAEILVGRYYQYGFRQLRSEGDHEKFRAFKIRFQRFLKTNQISLRDCEAAWQYRIFASLKSDFLLLLIVRTDNMVKSILKYR